VESLDDAVTFRMVRRGVKPPDAQLGTPILELVGRKLRTVVGQERLRTAPNHNPTRSDSGRERAKVCKYISLLLLQMQNSLWTQSYHRWPSELEKLEKEEQNDDYTHDSMVLSSNTCSLTNIPKCCTAAAWQGCCRRR